MMLTDGSIKNMLAMVDLDGTLIDTLEANYHAYKEALNEYGFDITRDQYAQKCDGRSYRDFLPEVLGGDMFYIEVIHERKIDFYEKCLKYAKVNYHLVNILRAIKADYYIALVTTASKKNTMSILQYFELENLFDRIVTQEDVEVCKPAPDCYIETRQWFGVKTENTIIFEDSPSGILAAQGSGCSVFKFLNKYV